MPLFLAGRARSQSAAPTCAPAARRVRGCRHQRGHRQRCVMPTFTKNTPNLIVSDLNRSLAFYRDLLGFSVVTTVPEKPPFVFVMLQAGGVEIFLNDLNA